MAQDDPLVVVSRLRKLCAAKDAQIEGLTSRVEVLTDDLHDLRREIALHFPRVSLFDGPAYQLIYRGGEGKGECTRVPACTHNVMVTGSRT